MNPSLHGHVALVTGANHGIGAAGREPTRFVFQEKNRQEITDQSSQGRRAINPRGALRL